MVEFSNQFGKILEKDIIEFEKDNDVFLPSDYKTFLRNHNGGRLLKNSLPDIRTNVDWLYGMFVTPDWASLFHALNVYHKRIPSWYIPIGHDPFGNLFLLSLFPDNHGVVAFWDHEDEAEGDADQYFDNMTLIATSFDEFIKQLQ